MDSFTMNGTHWKKLVETKRSEFECVRFRADIIYFVDHDEHRFAAAAQMAGNFTIQRNDSLLYVYHE